MKLLISITCLCLFAFTAGCKQFHNFAVDYREAKRAHGRAVYFDSFQTAYIPLAFTVRKDGEYSTIGRRILVLPHEKIEDEIKKQRRWQTGDTTWIKIDVSQRFGRKWHLIPKEKLVGDAEVSNVLQGFRGPFPFEADLPYNLDGSPVKIGFALKNKYLRNSNPMTGIIVAADVVNQIGYGTIAFTLFFLNVHHLKHSSHQFSPYNEPLPELPKASPESMSRPVSYH